MIKRKLKKIIKKFIPRKAYYVKINSINQENLLAGKKIVVTGGSSGIGYAIAKKLTEYKANVIITSSDANGLDKAKKELNCQAVEWDISNTNVIDEKLNEISTLFDNELDCFINCAGIYREIRYYECDDKNWDEVININLKGAYFATNKIIKKYFEKKKRGNIILICSNRGIFGDDGPYGISKAGLINYGMGLAKKVINKNIRVNMINPGMTASNINGIKDTDDLYNESLRGKRVIAAQEIAEIACFLASDRSVCITGQVLNCDNGESIL